MHRFVLHGFPAIIPASSADWVAAAITVSLGTFGTCLHCSACQIEQSFFQMSRFLVLKHALLSCFCFVTSSVLRAELTLFGSASTCTLPVLPGMAPKARGRGAYMAHCGTCNAYHANHYSCCSTHITAASENVPATMSGT